MARAVEQLEGQRTREAIPHEMAALQGLLRAQAEVRRRQVMQQQANGASNGGSGRQGQDLSANSGTPIVAPYAGTISWVNYQAGGAGYYVVLDANDGRDYVFMHMLKGSVNVKQGDVVPTGKLLGRVGSTGSSSGPHLHFEVWTGGPWQFGGKPVDPLRYLPPG